MAARKAGRTYTQLIGEIVDLALGRYGALKCWSGPDDRPSVIRPQPLAGGCGYAPPVTDSELSVKPTDAARTTRDTPKPPCLRAFSLLLRGMVEVYFLHCSSGAHLTYSPYLVGDM